MAYLRRKIGQITMPPFPTGASRSSRGDNGVEVRGGGSMHCRSPSAKQGSQVIGDHRFVMTSLERHGGGGPIHEKMRPLALPLDEEAARGARECD